MSFFPQTTFASISPLRRRGIPRAAAAAYAGWAAWIAEEYTTQSTRAGSGHKVTRARGGGPGRSRGKRGENENGGGVMGSPPRPAVSRDFPRPGRQFLPGPAV